MLRWVADESLAQSAIGGAAVRNYALRHVENRYHAFADDGGRTASGRLNCIFVAVTIRCKPRMLGSKRKWHDVADRTSQFQLRIAGRLDPASYRGEGVSLPIAARRMNADLLAIYTQEPDLADA